MTMMPMPDMNIGQIPTTQFNIPVQKKRGGMFGGGSPLKAIAGIIGDVLLQRNGHSPMYLPMMMQHMRDKREDAQYQRQRSDGLEDYRAKLGIQSEFKGPDYDAFQRRLIEGGIQPGTPEWVNAHKRKSEIELNPFVMTPYGPMPYSAVIGGGQQQAQPLTDEDILRMQGGPTPQASGGFPGPF